MQTELSYQSALRAFFMLADFDWNALHPEKLIAMTINSRKPMYDKQNITINCETSYFYFSEGVKWAIRWKNGSLEFINLGR